MELTIKAVIGAAVVTVITLVSRSKNYFVAGLIPLFPTFALIAHYIIGTERSVGDLKKTIVFGIFSLIPYLVYMISLYYLCDRLKLTTALICAVLMWLVTAAALVAIWTKM